MSKTRRRSPLHREYGIHQLKLNKQKRIEEQDKKLRNQRDYQDLADEDNSLDWSDSSINELEEDSD